MIRHASKASKNGEAVYEADTFSKHPEGIKPASSSSVLLKQQPSQVSEFSKVYLSNEGVTPERFENDYDDEEVYQNEAVITTDILPKSESSTPQRPFSAAGI